MSELESLEKLREYASVYIESSKAKSLSDRIYDLAVFADEIQAEIDSCYMRLPVDADGLPIHVGDVMTSSKGPIKVEGVHNDEFFILRHNKWLCLTAENYRHVKPRTLEDVLRDVVTLCANTWKDEKSAFRYYNVDNVMESGNIADFADEIRELLGSDE